MFIILQYRYSQLPKWCHNNNNLCIVIAGGLIPFVKGYNRRKKKMTSSIHEKFVGTLKFLARFRHLIPSLDLLLLLLEDILLGPTPRTGLVAES